MIFQDFMFKKVKEGNQVFLQQKWRAKDSWSFWDASFLLSACYSTNREGAESGARVLNFLLECVGADGDSCKYFMEMNLCLRFHLRRCSRATFLSFSHRRLLAGCAAAAFYKQTSNQLWVYDAVKRGCYAFHVAKELFLWVISSAVTANTASFCCGMNKIMLFFLLKITFLEWTFIFIMVVS